MILDDEEVFDLGSGPRDGRDLDLNVLGCVCLFECWILLNELALILLDEIDLRELAVNIV